MAARNASAGRSSSRLLSRYSGDCKFLELLPQGAQVGDAKRVVTFALHNVMKSKSIIVESKKANKYLRLDNSHGNSANKNLKTRYGDKDTNSEKLVGMMFS